LADFFIMLRAELAFYVGCLNLGERLTQIGEPMCVPLPRPWAPPRLRFTGLYDVCLSLRNAQRAVGNDADADGRTLIVVTGANSGGKSTFLRSVGLAYLMMRAGMNVAAESFDASTCEGVFTHFIREEDTSMTSGKLDEELSRMSDIADQVSPRCVVLFNESFSATNEREGSEIARQVLRALLDSDIRAVVVTHLYDLANHFYLHANHSTLFLQAGRESEAGRTFKLLPGEPLPTSFAEDVYQRIGGWLCREAPAGTTRRGPRRRRPGFLRAQSSTAPTASCSRPTSSTSSTEGCSPSATTAGPSSPCGDPLELGHG
jgi:DNA mismatch repair ATPase MutS